MGARATAAMLAKRRTRRRMGRTRLQTLATDSEYAAAGKAREPRAFQSPLCRNTPRCRMPTEPCPGDRSIKTDDIPQAGAPGTGRNGTKKNVAVSQGRMMVRSLISPIIPRWRTNHRRYTCRLSGESPAPEIYNLVLAYITTRHRGPGRNAVQRCKERCNEVDLIF